MVRLDFVMGYPEDHSAGIHGHCEAVSVSLPERNPQEMDEEERRELETRIKETLAEYIDGWCHTKEEMDAWDEQATPEGVQ